MEYPTINGITQLPTKPERLAVLDRVASGLPKYSSILEIGSLYGDSAKVLAKYGTVLCVDLFPFGIEQFLENTKGYDNIRIIQNSSAAILPTLPTQSFDLVYIDGDHTYPTVLHDLAEARRLVKINGIICGDDLERVLENDAEYDEALKLSHIDFIESYHPGVSCAVYSLSGDVNVEDGFWWYVR